MTKSRHILPPRVPFGPEEDAIIRALFPVNATHEVAALIDRTAASVVKRAKHLGVKKSPKYLESKAYRFNGSEPKSVATRFKPGVVPANKGLRRPGYAPGRMSSTQFKAGQRGSNWVPIGSTRINGDGYLDRKLADTNRAEHNWIAEHRLVWIAHHGAVPKGYIVTFKQGRRTTREADIAIDAIELITLAENMRRNTIHNLPTELKGAINALGGLRRSITCRSKREKQNRGSAQPPVRDARGAAGQGRSDAAGPGTGNR